MAAPRTRTRIDKSPLPAWRPAAEEPEVRWVDPNFEPAPPWAIAYAEPRLPNIYDSGLEFTDPRSRAIIARQIASVVEHHGPIHDDAIMRALKHSWGLGRTVPSDLRFAYDRAASYAISSTGRAVCREGDFLRYRPALLSVQVPRTADASRRPAREVAPGECELALVRLVTDVGSIVVAELRSAWVRLFGFVPIEADVDPAFNNAKATLVRRGKLVEVNGVVSLPIRRHTDATSSKALELYRPTPDSRFHHPRP